MSARDEVRRLHEDEEIVIAVKEVTGHGACVTLDESKKLRQEVR